MKSVAIVTPWYGNESSGGAESLARELATHLASSGLAVTILTTCSRSFLSDWHVNHFESGTFTEHGYSVRRFAASARDVEAFDNVNGALLELDPDEWKTLRVRDAATAPFIDGSILSTDMEAFLQESGAGFDAVLCIPYLYGIVVRAIEILGDRVHLIPCLHDEAYARIPRIAAAIHSVGTLLFNSDGEAELATRIYGPGILHKSHVIGSGLEEPPEPSFEPIPGIGNAPFFLYLGRRDSTKNVDFLIEAYRKFHFGYSESPVKLVLAGPGNRDYGEPEKNIVDLGFIDDSLKRTLLQKAVALFQPSTNESYSRVLMEAWREGTVVVAHRECLATALAVEQSAGGLVAGAESEWIDAMAYVDRLPNSERVEMGSRGRSFAREMSSWPTVVARLLDAVGISDRTKGRGLRIDQVVQTLEYGDAISDYAMHVRSRLERLGYTSMIWAEGIGSLVADKAMPFDKEELAKADAVLYHHSIGTGITDRVLELRIPKAVIYHNITPAAFFSGYRPAFAELLANGRAELIKLVGSFDRYIADSNFNAEELLALGVAEVETIPVIMDFSRFDVIPNLAILENEDGPRGTRWLFVGRVAPNKGLSRLLGAFEAFLCFDPNASLVIVGRYDDDDPYYAELRQTVAGARLETYVQFAGLVTDDVLSAHYQRADLFITLSEHEGFCVPVVEAMYFDLPVLALAATALPETLGSAGLLVERSASVEEIASLVYILCTDRPLRAAVLKAQREHRRSYAPTKIYPRIDKLVAELLG